MADPTATEATTTSEAGETITAVGRVEALERHLQSRFDDLSFQIAHGELTAYAQPERIRELLAFCRDDDELHFELLSDLSGVHWPGGEHFVDPQVSTTGWPHHRLTGDEARIEVTYHLYSVEHNHRLRVVVAVDDEDPRVPSVTEIYPTANYHEREVYDFFGVPFEGHPNLVRILMPDDWTGHPQRKDYPLGGVDTPYEGAFVPPPDERIWANDVPFARGEEDA